MCLQCIHIKRSHKAQEYRYYTLLTYTVHVHTHTREAERAAGKVSVAVHTANRKLIRRTIIVNRNYVTHKNLPGTHLPHYFSQYLVIFTIYIWSSIGMFFSNMFCPCVCRLDTVETEQGFFGNVSLSRI